MKKTYINPNMKIVTINTISMIAGSPDLTLDKSNTTSTMQSRRGFFFDDDEEE